MSLNCPTCGSELSLNLSLIREHSSLNGTVEPQLAPVEHVVALGSSSKPSPRNRFQYNDPNFNEFWTTYPRKVGKEAAAQTWKRLIGAGVEPQILIAAAQLAAQAWASNGTELRFIPYPQKWLNEGRFLDEVSAPPAVGETDPAYIVGTPEYEARMVAEGVW